MTVLKPIEEFLSAGEDYLRIWYSEHGKDNKLERLLSEVESKLKKKWEATEEEELKKMMEKRRRSTWEDHHIEVIPASDVNRAVLDMFKCTNINELPPLSSICVQKMISAVVYQSTELNLPQDLTDQFHILKTRLILDSYHKRPLPSNAPTVQLYHLARSLLSQFDCLTSTSELLDSLVSTSQLLNNFVTDDGDTSQVISQLSLLLSDNRLRIFGRPVCESLFQQSQHVLSQYCYGRGCSATIRYRVFSELLKSQVINIWIGGPVQPISIKSNLLIAFDDVKHSIDQNKTTPTEVKDDKTHRITSDNIFCPDDSDVSEQTEACYESCSDVSSNSCSDPEDIRTRPTLHDGCLPCGGVVSGSVMVPREFPTPLGPPSPLIELLDIINTKVTTQIIMPHAIHDGIVGGLQAACSGVVSNRDWDSLQEEIICCTIALGAAVGCSVVTHPASAVWLTTNLLRTVSTHSEYLLEDFTHDNTITSLLRKAQLCYVASRKDNPKKLLKSISILHNTVSQFQSTHLSSSEKLSRWLAFQSDNTLNKRIPVPHGLSSRVREFLLQINPEEDSIGEEQLYCGTILLFRDEMLYKEPDCVGLIPHCVWEDLQHIAVLIASRCSGLGVVLQNSLVAAFSSAADGLSSIEESCYHIYKATDDVVHNLIKNNFISDWETISTALARQTISENNLPRRRSRRSIISISGNRKNSLFGIYDDGTDTDRCTSASSSIAINVVDQHYSSVISSLVSNSYSTLPELILSYVTSNGCFITLAESLSETLQTFSDQADISLYSQIAFAQAIAMRAEAKKLRNSQQENNNTDNIVTWAAAAEAASKCLSTVVAMDELIIWSKREICEELISTVSILNTEVRREKRSKEREKHATSIQSAWRSHISFNEMSNRRKKLRSNLPALFSVSQNYRNIPFLRLAFAESVSTRTKNVNICNKIRLEKRIISEITSNLKSQRDQQTTSQLLSTIDHIDNDVEELTTTREVISLKCRLLKRILRQVNPHSQTTISILSTIEKHLRRINQISTPTVFSSNSDYESCFWISPSVRHSFTGELLFINSPSKSVEQRDSRRNQFICMTKNVFINLIRANIIIKQFETVRMLCRYGVSVYPEEENQFKNIERDVSNIEKAEPLVVHTKRRYKYKIDTTYQSRKVEENSSNADNEKKKISASERENRRKARFCRLTGEASLPDVSSKKFTRSNRSLESTSIILSPDLQLTEQLRRNRLVERQNTFYQSLRDVFDTFSSFDTSHHQIIASPRNDCVV